MKIAMVIGTMAAAGGAERIFSYMLNDWASKGHELLLYTFDHESAPSFYPLPESIVWHKMGGQKKWWQKIPTTFGKAVFFLREEFKKHKPEIVLSFMNVTNLTVLVATQGLGIPCIISDRNHPAYDGLNSVFKLLKWVYYRKANKLVVLTKNQIQCYPKLIHPRIRAILNPVFAPAEEVEKVVVPFKKPFILSVGRLRRQKGHDVLIRSFAKIASEIKEYHLVIIGEGIERASLETLIKNERMEDRIFLPGIHKGVYEIMAQAEIFVFPSRWEGLGNAYIEAMARGIPVLACDCQFGPGEIITHDDNGLLTPAEDVHTMALNLKRLCQDQELRFRLSQNAKGVLERLEPEKMMNEWDQLIQEVVKKRV